MDPNGAFRPLDESLLRELPQLQSLRIAPLREPVSSRILSVPSPLEPNTSTTRESHAISKTNAPNGNLSAKTNASLPTVTEFLNAARTRKSEPSVESQANVDPPPKPILPAFVNLRAIERFPFSSSFDDDALHAPRKRRRLDVLTESFSDHLQLPIPQAQKEQRPPPFGPFAILNGLNEPPPNAALLPPIEAGSISQLLAKPSRDEATLDSGNLVSANESFTDAQPSERREPRLEELLDSAVDDKDAVGENRVDGEDDNGAEKQAASVEDLKVVGSTGGERNRYRDAKKSAMPASLGDEPMSPKTRGRSRKNLRKWTEEETTALLRGVIKCGIGNWTTILAQPELKFNKRTASNLKDRFRVCCPWAYRAADPNEATKQLHDTLANAILKANPQGFNETNKIHLPIPRQPSNTESESNSGAGSPASNSHKPSASSMSSSTLDTDIANSTNTQPQTLPAERSTPTLSEKWQSTLDSLGVPEPHVTLKSKRRSRRPFTSAEDEALLKGYAVHGFQWTLIQQDTRLNLGHRRATDLRDRFRTKFPHAYRDGGSVSGRDLHDQSQFSTSSRELGSGPRDRTSEDEKNTTKPFAATQSRPGRKRRVASITKSNPGPIDPALLLPTPPQGFFEPSATNPPGTSNLPSLPPDEASTTAATSATVDTPWEDNTLAPMTWDELN